MTIEPVMITPPVLAKRWGVKITKIYELINTRQLRAYNLAVDPNGQRPRYRIKIADVEEFERTRSTKR